MWRAIITSLALLGLTAPCLAAEATQGPPDFGIDTSGTLRKLNLRDATLGTRVPMGYIDTTTHTYGSLPANAVESYGAKGDSNGTTGNGTDDTAAIEACVAGGRVCSLRPGATYRLMSAIDIPSNGGLIGDKTATLYCDPAGINNTLRDLPNRYLQTGQCIKAEGPSGDPTAAVTNVLLKDFKINWGGNSGGRCCQAVDVRNAKDAIIDGLEIFNLSTYGIRFASWQGGSIINNYVHDASNDIGFEYSAIQGDDDIISGLPSHAVLIADNRLVNMLMSQAGYNNTLTDPSLPDGYQPNGIKIVNKSSNMIIRGNRISYTGQGIDFYGNHSLIEQNAVEYTVAIGIALKHGATYNTLSGNTVRYAGASGMASNGDDGDPNAYNIFANNVIERVGETAWPGSPNNSGTPPGFLAGLYAAADTACIAYATPGLPDPNPPRSDYEVIAGNTCDPGPSGRWAWYPRSGSFSHNYWFNNYGKTGTSGIWAIGGGMLTAGRHGGAKIDAFVPWTDVAAATQVNLSLADSNLLNITGAATINDFIGGEAGQYYFVRFNGVMTLRCTGFLVCPGGVNLVTAAGDVMMVVVEKPSTSGLTPVYRVLFYSRASGATTLFNSGITISLGSAGGTALSMLNTKDDATGTLTSCSRQRSGTPVNGDELCGYVIAGKNTAGTPINMGGYNFSAINVAPGTETAAWRWYTAYLGGAMSEHMRLSGGLRLALNPGVLNDPGEGGIAFAGKFGPDQTLTAPGTTGAQTINKPAGGVNFAAAATSLVVTNSLVTVFSIVLCTVQSNDTTMKSAACVPTTGSFTIYPNANPTAETKVGFLVMN